MPRVCKHKTLQVDFYDEAGIAAYKNHVKDSEVAAPTPVHSATVNHPVSYWAALLTPTID